MIKKSLILLYIYVCASILGEIDFGSVKPINFTTIQVKKKKKNSDRFFDLAENTVGSIAG